MRNLFIILFVTLLNIGFSTAQIKFEEGTLNETLKKATVQGKEVLIIASGQF